MQTIYRSPFKSDTIEFDPLTHDPHRKKEAIPAMILNAASINTIFIGDENIILFETSHATEPLMQFKSREDAEAALKAIFEALRLGKSIVTSEIGNEIEQTQIKKVMQILDEPDEEIEEDL